MNKWKKGIALIVVAAVLNVFGRYIAYHFDLPAYLDLCGTVMAAYILGPAAGIIAAISGCALSLIFSGTDWYFLIADIAVAVAAGLVAKRNKYFSKFYLIMSPTAFFALIKAFILTIINVGISGGRSGLYIADAVIDYLENLSAPAWLCFSMAALFISFADVIAAMLLVFLTVCISQGFGKRKRSAELKKQLRAHLTTGLLLITVFSYAAAPFKSLADDSVSFTEKLYNSENGLTGGCVNDVAMTRDGTMWVGTYGGLFRFNGSRFALMDNIASVRSVQSLYVDNEDRLWAGTQDAGVTLLNIDMSWRTVDMSSGLLSNSVKCISRDSNGLYYFGTTSGLAVAEYNEGEIRVIKTVADAGNIKDMSPDKEGHMIVMNNLGGVSCYDRGVLINDLDILYDTPKGIRHDNDDNIYIGTDSEAILVYRFESNTFKRMYGIYARGLKTVRDVYFDDNDICFVAADNGVGYFDPDGQFTTIETGEFNNSIEHIYKDYQGNIWFTSSRCGLLCLGKSSFVDVFKLCNEKSTVCNAIRYWNGHLYVGTNTGLKILDVDAGLSIKNNITAVFDGIRIRGLSEDNAGNLLCATYEKGLMQITPEGIVSQYVSVEETEKQVRIAYVLSDGTIISSSDAGLVFLKDHKVMRRLRLGKDLSGGTVINMLELSDGTVLGGTDGDGIAVIKNGRPERYISREDGLSSGVILRIVEDKRGGGYFVLTGSGLCYMDKDFNIRELRMPYFNNYDLVVNEAGDIFVLGGAGIYISDYKSLMELGNMQTYTLLDIKAGLPGSITSNSWNYVSEDERLFFCGTSGAYLLDLNNYEMKVDGFKTKITSMKLDGEYQDVTQFGTINIPKGADKVELELEINNYTSADPYVSYYLKGIDAERTIVLSSMLGSVKYNDIPYGDHEFIINVTDERGRILSSQTYVLSKERELYETTGFKLYFYIMLLTVISFLVISIVQGALWTQRIRESSRHKQIVSQLEKEKSEAMQRAIYMEEDANRTKAEFLANMSHEIRTPINTIIGMDTMIMRESGEESIKQYARDIDKAGKELLSLINNVLDFSKNGTDISDSGAEEEDTNTEAAENTGAPAEDDEDEVLRENERFHAPEAAILLVDDVEMNHKVVSSLLKRLRIKPDSAMSAQDAIKAVKEKKYDIIFLETMLQEMKGEEIMRIIRTKSRQNADTPIIAFTTNAAEGAREEYFNLGYTNYLSKPVDSIKLEAMIQSYLPDDKIVFADEDDDEA